MKKKLYILIAVLTFVSFTGCQKKDDAETTVSTETTTIEETSSESETQTEAIQDNKLGFDEKSLELLKSGELEKHISDEYEIEQSISNDLDLDEIDDVLMITRLAGKVEDENPSVVLLKGNGDGTFEKIKENENMLQFTGDPINIISDKAGEFKIIGSSSKNGGSEYSYLFRYSQNDKDWILNEYYSNRYGNIANGESKLITPLNFGNVSFENFKFKDTAYEGSTDNNNLKIDENNVKLNMDYVLISLADEAKQTKINNLIMQDVNKIVNGFQNLGKEIDASIKAKVTYQNPNVISIEYEVSKSNYNSNYVENPKFFTTNIDINSEKRIEIKDLIIAEKLAEIAKKAEFGNTKNSANYGNKFDESAEDLAKVFSNSDKIENAFNEKDTKVFMSLYENSMCIYFMPGDSYKLESIKKYISKNELSSSLLNNIWAEESKSAQHIIW